MAARYDVIVVGRKGDRPQFDGPDGERFDLLAGGRFPQHQRGVQRTGRHYGRVRVQGHGYDAQRVFVQGLVQLQIGRLVVVPHLHGLVDGTRHYAVGRQLLHLVVVGLVALVEVVAVHRLGRVNFAPVARPNAVVVSIAVFVRQRMHLDESCGQPRPEKKNETRLNQHTVLR